MFPDPKIMEKMANPATVAFDMLLINVSNEERAVV
jgi:hypothetical protein